MAQGNKTIPLYDQVKFDIYNAYNELNNSIDHYLTSKNKLERRNIYKIIIYKFREFMRLLVTEKKLETLYDMKAKTYLLSIYYNARKQLTENDLYLIQGITAQFLENFGLTNFEVANVNLETFLVDEDEE